MRLTETAAGLAGFERRGPGTDAERRAALWLAEQLERGGREVRIEPFWCRPNWALAHVWHLILAIGGSLLAIPSPWAGAALVLIALLSLLADELFGVSLGRRLSPERASQNVVAAARTATQEPQPSQARLIITANYDAGRTGLAYRPFLRSTTARITRSLRGFTLGWLGWTAIAILWLLGTAILRIAGGVSSPTIGAIQIVPAVGLLSALAFLVDLVGRQLQPRSERQRLRHRGGARARRGRRRRPAPGDRRRRPPPRSRRGRGHRAASLSPRPPQRPGPCRHGCRRDRRVRAPAARAGGTATVGSCRFATRRSCATSAPVSPPTSRTCTPRRHRARGREPRVSGPGAAVAGDRDRMP